MRLLKMMIVMVALGGVFAAGSVRAQEAPAPQAAPVPQPFPEGARIAYIDLQFIASNSAEGKAATAKIQDFTKKAQADLAAKSKQMEDLRNKLLQGGTVMSDQARMQLEREIEKLARELQFAQQDAQDEQTQLTATLQNEFQTRLNPIIDEVAKEKALHMVFSIVDSGAVWANTGLDITSEVMKRLDASTASKGAAPAKE